MQQRLSPRHGADLIRFAREVVDLLRANPTGLDKDAFIQLYFPGNPPTSRQDREFYWQEFKRAAKYSTVMFELEEEGWSFVRALQGPRRGQFYYVAVATIISGQPTVEVPYPIAEQLDDRTTREWVTRTRNRMRIRVADLQAKIASGNPTLAAEAEEQFDEIAFISTRLAAINFDSGMSLEDLRQLANPRDHRLRILGAPIRRALDAVEKAQDRINDLADLVYGLRELMTSERRRLGQGAGGIDQSEEQ